MKQLKLYIDGMTCAGCEARIKSALIKIDGVKGVSVSYKAGVAEIEFGEGKVSAGELITKIEELGYKVSETPPKNKKNTASQLAGAAALILALYILISRIGTSRLAGVLPLASEGMGYGMLFVVGLLTSLHCVAMCGGINLSVSMPQGGERRDAGAAILPSLLYNFGRILSYTVIGGIVGAIGSAISLSGTVKGIVQLVAGVFMILMGLNMLGVFPWLRKLTPRLPGVLAGKIGKAGAKKSPFIVGLLNGFMPCGPLQAMQLYALSTGSMVKGALSMLAFGLGTAPLMLGLGAFASLISKKHALKAIKIFAAAVVALGIAMLQNGMSLAGIAMPFSKPGGGSVAKIEGSAQVVTTELLPGRYVPITVQKGIPVKWIIKADKENINGCNNEIYIPKYDIIKKLEPGDNIIEFIPTETGVFPYTCWMGMIRSSITVVDELNKGMAQGG
ncbi:MAG TPA: heavy metal transporter [Clostridiales bacterium]|nr:heavy metal transporter [Clostridiales bacterium]